MSSDNFTTYRTKASNLESKLNSKMAPAIQEQQLDDAYGFYRKAAESARNGDDLQSTLKDVQRVLIEKMKFYRKNPQYCTNYWQAVSKLIEDISYLHSRLRFKTGSNQKADFGKIPEEIDRILDDVEKHMWSNIDPYEASCLMFGSFAQGADKNAMGFKLFANYKYADYLFKEGVKSLENDEMLLNARKVFKEAYTPLEAGQYIIDRSKRVEGIFENEKKWLGKWEKEFEIKRNEVLMESKRTDAKILLQEAEKQHLDAITNKEVFGLEDAIDIYDLYHQVLTIARDFDIEIEAHVCCKMGVYHYKILHFPDSKEKARKLFQRSIQLALSLSPKNVTKEDWYKTAENHARELQKQQQKAEHVENLTEREKFSEELQTLKTFLEKNVEFDHNLKTELNNLFNQYEPKCKFDRESFNEISSDKKMVLKALTWYHPDKQQSKDGKLWELMCEDISSYLNRMLEKVKL
ncbi:uncharacterized protein LOC142351488 [Convolutriloba macropyga]|uniref:uncharacterized protein LOC142351488 n=1 Tax=Convolutriloba macropyga TaxID=536237 RepID=UPI003F51D86B